MATILDFSNILEKKIHLNQCAHLYCLTYNSQYETGEFLAETLKKSLFNQSELSHPDFLIVKRDVKDEDKEYKTRSQSIEEYLEFTQFRPIKTPKKIAIILDAHMISDIVQNKLLKLFEESPPYLITLLCYPNEHTLLPTILSRSINVHLHPVRKNKTPMDEVNLKNFKEISDFLKRNQDQESRILAKIIEEILESEALDYKKLETLIIGLKRYQDQKTFNGPILSRLASLAL